MKFFKLLNSKHKESLSNKDKKIELLKECNSLNEYTLNELEEVINCYERHILYLEKIIYCKDRQLCKCKKLIAYLENIIKMKK